MGASESLGKISRVIDRFESDGGMVRHVEVQLSDRKSETGLNATLDVPVSLCPEENSRTAESRETAVITDDGGLKVEFAPSILPDLSEYVSEEISVVEEGARVTESGTAVVTVTLTSEAETGRQDPDELTSRTTGSHASAATNAAKNDEVISGNDTATTDDRGAATTPTEDAESRADGESDPDGVRDEDLPLYKDDEYLQHLYESYRTFDEMTRRIEMSISSETVRRYMIEADIHEPSTYETSDETAVADDSSSMEDVSDVDDGVGEQIAVEERTGGAPSPPSAETVQDERTDESSPDECLSDVRLAADGIGLPDGLTIEELANAIESSMTVFDVQRKLDLGCERTVELLKQLNLIDLVMGRLSHKPDRQVTQEEIINRIRSGTNSNWAHAPDEGNPCERAKDTVPRRI